MQRPVSRSLLPAPLAIALWAQPLHLQIQTSASRSTDHHWHQWHTLPANRQRALRLDRPATKPRCSYLLIAIMIWQSSTNDRPSLPKPSGPSLSQCWGVLHCRPDKRSLSLSRAPSLTRHLILRHTLLPSLAVLLTLVLFDTFSPFIVFFFRLLPTSLTIPAYLPTIRDSLPLQQVLSRI